MKTPILLFLTAIVLISFPAKSQTYLSYTYDTIQKKVFYEGIMQVDSMGKADLLNQVRKYISVNAIMRYDDGKELLATGRFKTLIRRHYFLLFHKTTYKYAAYTMHFQFKDNKIKYTFYDFYLIPLAYNINSSTWFSPNQYIGKTNIGSVSTTSTKIPMEIPQKPLEVYYLKNYTKKKNKLFYDINDHITADLVKIQGFIKTSKSDW